MRYVMIGNSYAGLAAAEAVRRRDPKGEIMVLSDERHEAYGRPLISYYLGGETPPERMNYRPAAFYRNHRIQVRTDSRVVKVLPDSRHLQLADGTDLAYDRLMISTGGKPFVPPMKGTDARGVFTFTTWQDADDIKEWLPRVRDVIVIGGGLIGLSAADALRHRGGVGVTVVEMLPRVLGLALDEDGSNLLQNRMVELGTQVVTEDSVTEIVPDGDGVVQGVVLKSGRELPCQMVVVAIGVRPNTGFLQESGIQINRGIVVDERMATNLPGVYAAGDVAEGYDVINADHRIIAILPVAYEMGLIAGANMAGDSQLYAGGIAMNSMPKFEMSVMTMGLTLDQPDLEAVRRRRGDQYQKFLFRGDQLVGAILVGDTTAGGVLTALIKKQETLTAALKERILYGNYRSLVAERKLTWAKAAKAAS
ncbi:MAG: FAD-dependent oxidoreductase [Thermaerobacter sp.]|jgi:NAD(P)H-nitrite reductase large subunit|nr:FAD-dependent oxidoreductase [Thermaerobacter sp.]